jgi:hypothetical protein
MKELLIGLAVGGLLVAVAIGQSARSNAPSAAESTRKSEIGGYQIVNGTPEFAANIMLLDTVTGDSWIKCGSDTVGDLWCRMPRSDNGTSGKK